MDKSEYYKKLFKNGRLLVDYDFLKIFTPCTALVLSRLNAELNYACNNSYLINECFAYDEKEIAQSINFTVEEVKKSIEELEGLNLISTMVIKSVNLIHIKYDKVCHYLSDKQYKLKFNNWDYGLSTIQKNAYMTLAFDNNSKEEIETIKNKMFLSQLARDKNGNILYF